MSAWSQPENLRIKLAHLTGSWEAVTSTLHQLQDMAANTGVGLEQLAGGFEELTQSGFTAGRALDLVNQAGGLDGLLGGNGQGVAAIVSALSGLNESAEATEDDISQPERKALIRPQQLSNRLRRLLVEMSQRWKRSGCCGLVCSLVAPVPTLSRMP
jgi:hypothetical protein